jgi:hypothetical protein
LKYVKQKGTIDEVRLTIANQISLIADGEGIIAVDRMVESNCGLVLKIKRTVIVNYRVYISN